MITPASASMQSLHRAANNPDLAPICNGTGSIKWISLSTYYQTGDILFVDLPTNEPANTDNAKCSLCTIVSAIDDDNDSLILSRITLLSAQYTAPFSTANIQRNSTSAKANARAPPSINHI